ncbi:MAG: HpcH/HpaI aldolase/citrate lyase family protein [Rhizomicrobium sp.]
MAIIANGFKRALKEKRLQIGLWQVLANAHTAEICATMGFDWLLFDSEHAPNDVPRLQAQLQAVAAYPVHPVARVPIGETWIVKQYLDTGVQTILVPLVDTAEQARALVKAMRYAPEGVRGVGSSGARASRWSAHGDYVEWANAEVCLLVQAETRQALDNLDAIADVEGVDGIFIGPNDLAASLGHRGKMDHPDVQRAIGHAMERIAKAGKAGGILSGNDADARRYIDAGFLFVAVGSDAGLLAGSGRELAARYKA